MEGANPTKPSTKFILNPFLIHLLAMETLSATEGLLYRVILLKLLVQALFQQQSFLADHSPVQEFQGVFRLQKVFGLRFLAKEQQNRFFLSPKSNCVLYFWRFHAAWPPMPYCRLLDIP